MKLYTITQLRTDFEKAVKWVDSHGAKISNTRHDRYLRHISKVENYYIAGDISKLTVDDSEKHRSVVFEMTELIELHRAFKKFQPPGIDEGLKELISGKDSYDNESTDSKTHARDIAFELLIAARIFSRGGKISLKLTDDVTWLRKKGNVSVQCKRCKSIGAVPKRLKRATEQIETDIQGRIGNVRHGIIAVDLTPAINPHFNIYHGRNIQEAEARAYAHLQNWLKNVIGKYKQKSKSVHAILVKFAYLAHATGSSDSLQRQVPIYGAQYGLWAFDESSVVRDLAKILDDRKEYRSSISQRK